MIYLCKIINNILKYNYSNLSINKKGISPVVAIALLLVVTIFAIVSYQTWYVDFQSEIFSKAELQSNSAYSQELQIQELVGNNLYILNSKEENVSIKELKIEGILCFNDKDLTFGMNEIDVSSCLSTIITQKPNFLVITKNQVLSKYFYIDKINKFVRPTITFVSSNYSLDWEQSVTLNWTSSNADTCEASGDWVGEKNVSDIFITPLLTNAKIYTITCSNAIYVASESVTINVGDQDITPDSFVYTNLTNQNINSTIESEILTIAGFSGDIGGTISGDGSPEFQINGVGWSSSVSDLNSGDTLKIRLNTSSNYYQVHLISLTLGTVSYDWSVQNKVQDKLPDVVDFNDLFGQDLNSNISSNILTFTGFEGLILVQATISGNPMISKNSGEFVNSSFLIQSGDTVQLELSTDDNILKEFNVSVEVGDLNINWSVQTKSLNFNWNSTIWSACDDTCGTGGKTRSVWCSRADGLTVADLNCVTIKPITSDICSDYSTCSFDWLSGIFGSCSETCGTGSESRTVECERSDSSIVPDLNCVALKPDLAQSCSDYSSCSYSWINDAWGSCSNTCGTGTHSRTVYCERSDGTTVADGSCVLTKPDISESCNDYSTCASCTLDGQTVTHGNSFTFFDSSLPSGTSCNGLSRTCSNGVLSGSSSFNKKSCLSGCSLDAVNLTSGMSNTFYSSDEVPFGNTCLNQLRVCTDGVLSGSYGFEKCYVENHFISLWDTNIDAGLGDVSLSNQIKLPLQDDGDYDFTVTSNYLIGGSKHITSYLDNTLNFTQNGIQELDIFGKINGFSFNAGTNYYDDNKDDGDKLIEIKRWGTLSLGDGGRYFSSCENIIAFGDDTLNMTGTTNLSHMFYRTYKFNKPLNNFNTTNVISMYAMFSGATIFNQPLNFDMSNVINMGRMFESARKFNQPLNWDTSSVTNMESMFSDAWAFNNTLNLNTSKVINMKNIFRFAGLFNQPLNWDTSSVINMEGLLYAAREFNQPLNWDTSSVTNMKELFSSAREFNQPLNWDTNKVTSMNGMFGSTVIFNETLILDTSSVVDMSSMFGGATIFNQPLNFDTSKVTTMNNMFSGANSYNQPLNFDTSNVTNMYYMFANANSFNQLLNWNTINVTDMGSMFYGASSYNQPLNFDTSNVTSMHRMFYQASNFNQLLNDFDTSKVTTMREMFYQTSSFNQPLSNFDTGEVTSMYQMFYQSSSFNQDLNNFDTSKVTSMDKMFYQASSFNQDLTSWCVTLIGSEPTSFASSSPLRFNGMNPLWGTCP